MTCKTESWREVFERARVIPPHSQTVRQAQEAHLTASHGFQILLNRVTGPHIQQVYLCLHISFYFPVCLTKQLHYSFTLTIL